MAKAHATSPAHTPGPWRTDSIGTDRVWILDSESNYLAEIVAKDECGFAAPTAQQEANARLIASAPELLAALRDLHGLACTPEWERDDEEAERIRVRVEDAIERATGMPA